MGRSAICTHSGRVLSVRLIRSPSGSVTPLHRGRHNTGRTTTITITSTDSDTHLRRQYLRRPAVPTLFRPPAGTGTDRNCSLGLPAPGWHWHRAELDLLSSGPRPALAPRPNRHMPAGSFNPHPWRPPVVFAPPPLFALSSRLFRLDKAKRGGTIGATGGHPSPDPPSHPLRHDQQTRPWNQPVPRASY